VYSKNIDEANKTDEFLIQFEIGRSQNIPFLIKIKWIFNPDSKTTWIAQRN